MIIVIVEDDESFEQALRRFRVQRDRERINKSLIRKRYYMKPGDRRRHKRYGAEITRRLVSRRHWREDYWR